MSCFNSSVSLFIDCLVEIQDCTGDHCESSELSLFDLSVAGRCAYSEKARRGVLIVTEFGNRAFVGSREDRQFCIVWRPDEQKAKSMTDAVLCRLTSLLNHALGKETRGLDM